MKFIEALRSFVKAVEGGEVWTETPEETLTRFCKMVREGKIKAWVFVLGLRAFSVDRDGSVRSKEDVTFLSSSGLSAPELRFIGARLVSRAEEMDKAEEIRRFNL